MVSPDSSYARFLETIPDAAIVFNRSGEIVLANLQALAMFGYQRGELPGQSIQAWVPEAAESRHARHIDSFFANPPVRPMGIGLELSGRRRDGSEFPADIMLSPIVEGDEQFAVGIIREDSASNRSRLALLESDTRYRSLFENMLEGFAYCQMLFDEHQRPQDFIYLDVNNAFETLTGLKNVIGKRVSEVIPGIKESNPELFEIYGRVALTGQPERFDAHLESLGSAWLSMSVHSTQKEFFVVVFDNITERSRVEQALRTSEQRYRGLFEDSPIALWEEDYSSVKQRLEALRQQGITDFRAYFENHPELVAEYVALIKVLDVNRAALKMDGAGSKAELLESLPRVFGPESYPAFVDELVSVAQGRTDMQWERPNRTLSGDSYDISLSWSTVPGHEDTLSRVIISVIDITERQRAAREVQRRAEQFALLYDAGLALNSLVEPHGQLETIFNIALQALGAARGEFFRYEAARQELRLELVYGYPEELVPTAMKKLEFVFGQEHGLVGWVGLHRQRLYVPDVRADPRWSVIDPDIRSAVWVPVEHEGQLLGILGVLGESTDAFSLDDQRLLELFATQLAVALANARRFEETHQRLAELEAINKISTALRTAKTLDEMLPVLLDLTLDVMHASQGAIWLYDPARDELRPAVVRGWGEQPGVPAQESVKPGEGITGHVFATGQAYVASEFRLAPHLADSARQRLPPGVGGAAIPIRAGDKVIGTFTVNVPAPRELTPSEVHLLTTLSEIAGNAIQRSRLHEQTERRLQHLAALRDIDRAIGSSFDLRLSLSTLLSQVIAQLGVDAADVLVYDPNLLTLEYAAGQGFRTQNFERSQLRLGEGYAGRAALERRLIHVPDLTAQQDNPRLAKALAGEDFVSYHGVPLTAKGQIKGALELFHRAPLDPDAEWLDFMEALAGQAAIAIDNAQLFDSLQRLNTKLFLAYDATIEGWSRALDLRDKETEGHTRRVSDMTGRLAVAFGLRDDELGQVRWGALLHDIGKMGVPDGILLKPGPLTDEEWVLMKKHPTLAYEMLSPIQFLRSALDIPYCHHEKWDGTGYPRGLAGEQIPLAARIFAVVDVWDALTSDRPYRPAWPADRVLEHIRSLAGTHFDPRVLSVALESGVLSSRARS